MFTIFLNFHLDIHLGTSQCSPGLFSMFTIFTWTLRLQPLPRLPLRSHLLLSIDWLLGWLLVWSVEILSCSILIRVCLFFVCLFVRWSDQSPGKGLQWDSLAPSLLRSTPGGNVYQNENVENKVGNEMGEKGRWAHPFTHDLNSSRRKRSSYISGRTKKDLGIFGDKVDNSSDGEAHGSFTRSLKYQCSNSTTWPILPALKKI